SAEPMGPQESGHVALHPARPGDGWCLLGSELEIREHLEAEEKAAPGAGRAALRRPCGKRRGTCGGRSRSRSRGGWLERPERGSRPPAPALGALLSGSGRGGGGERLAQAQRPL